MKGFISMHPELFKHIFCIIIMLAGIVYILKLENRNFKLRKEKDEAVNKFNSLETEYENLKFDKTLSNEMIKILKEDKYKLSKLNNNLNQEIIELNKYKEDEITISSNAVNDTNKIIQPNKNESQLVHFDENVLCNNLFLFESKKKCWKCKKIHKLFV